MTLYQENPLISNWFTSRWKINEFSSLISCHWVHLIPHDIHPFFV